MSIKLSLFASYVLFYLLFVVSAKECDKNKCKGPLMFYEDLKCKAVYAKKDDCCAIRYDCSHLNGRSRDKCYYYGREYPLRANFDEDLEPCEAFCICADQKQFNKAATFICAVADGVSEFEIKEEEKDCEFKRVPGSCFKTKKVCPNDNEYKIKCENGGQTYRYGDSFTPVEKPEALCYCMEGYKGEIVAPYCNIKKCKIEMKHSNELMNNCAPVYYDNRSPRSTCPYIYKCQDANDVIVHPKGEKSVNITAEENIDMMCKYGNMKMHIGDELNEVYDRIVDGVIKCTCEVPPTLTCVHKS